MYEEHILTGKATQNIITFKRGERALKSHKNAQPIFFYSATYPEFFLSNFFRKKR